MAKILAYGSPSLGHLYPMLALLRELSARDHLVELRTMASQVDTARSAGLDAAPVNPDIETITGQDWLAATSFGVLKMSIDVMARRAPVEVDDLCAAIDSVRPDAMVIDANCWGAISMAEASGIPWLVFSPFTPYLRQSGVPPFGPGLPPLAGTAGRMRDGGVSWVAGKIFDTPMSRHINPIRRRLGLSPIVSADELMRRAPLLLAVGGPPFEYYGTAPEDPVQFIGACVYDPPGLAPAWLDSIDRPIVLVNTSSIPQADAVLGRYALAGLAEEPVHVVATFPAGIPDGLDPPPNATVCRFAPHGPLLERSICAITHGGMGSTLKALDRGIPVCVVPFARDQAEVARRVELASCGTRLPARRLTARRLRDSVKQAIRMSEGAREVAAGFAKTGGARRGADLVETRLLRISGHQAEG